MLIADEVELLGKFASDPMREEVKRVPEIGQKVETKRDAYKMPEFGRVQNWTGKGKYPKLDAAILNLSLSTWKVENSNLPK